MSARSLFELLVLAALLAACSTTKESRKKDGCETYLVVPPQHPSLAASDAVTAAWVEKARAELEACDGIVKPDAAKELFRFINVSNLRPLDGKNPGAAQLATLRAKSRTTHVVILTYKVAGRKLTALAKTYRLRGKWQLVSTETVHKQLEKGNPLRAGAVFDYRTIFAGLVPNAVTVGIGDSTLRNDRVDGNEVEELEAHRTSALPRFIQGVGFANVTHRYGYRLWDADYGLSGSVRLLADSPRLVYQFEDPAKRGTPDETFEYRYDFLAVAVLATLDGFLYSPLGTTFMGVGVGLAPYRFSDSVGRAITSVDALTRIRFGQRAFLTDRWYLEVSFDFVSFSSGLVKSDEFYADTMVSGFLGLGWFFPRRGWLE